MLLFIVPLLFLGLLIDDRSPWLYGEMFLLLTLLLLALATLQTLMLFANKRVLRYKDLAKLLLITKEMEHEFELFGGSGKGLYEKAKSLYPHISKETLHEIFLIAETRNKAMHNDPAIPNAALHLANAKRVLDLLKSMHSRSYLLKMWGARAVMALSVMISAWFLFGSHTLGQALFFTLLAYLLQAFLVHRYGYAKYMIFMFLLLMAGVVFILYLQGALSHAV